MYLKGGDSQRAEDASPLKSSNFCKNPETGGSLPFGKSLGTIHELERLSFSMIPKKTAQDYSKSCMEFVRENAVRYIIVAQDKDSLQNFTMY